MKQHPIELKNVKVHNLKNVSLTLRSGELIVFTGVSGSGKSSLAFDAIYVEGQRRYIESLSNYARRYIGNLTKPDAEAIEGISPTIAIEQKTTARNPRSTVGTMSGIYDYLRVLFARVATPYCPISGEKIKPQSIERILSTLQEFPEKSKLIFLAPHIQGKKGEFKELLDGLIRKGFTKIRLDQNIVDLTEEISIDKSTAHDIDLVVDRLIFSKEEKIRLTETVNQALELGNGLMSVLNSETGVETLFSRHAYAKKSKQSYLPLEPHDFSFNHPSGMCLSCEGLGIIQDFDLDLIIDPELSILEDCCSIAGSYQTVKWGNIYQNLATYYQFDLDTPWKHLPEQAKKVFLYGNEKKWTPMQFTHPKKKTVWTEYVKWRGVLYEAKKRFHDAKSDAYRASIKKLMRETICPNCEGSRIKPYPSRAQIGKKEIQQVTALTIEEATFFFKELTLPPFEAMIAHDLLLEIQKRLSFLLNVGLHYLTLDRSAPTLSGGEAQRLRLASQIGSGLINTIYILDEPSIGLHPRDQTKLIETLKMLRDRGNTIIVVEHDRETIEAADYVVDLGPKAGTLGGEIVGEGTIETLMSNPLSLTGAYLSGKKQIPIPSKRKKPLEKHLVIKGATHHNLKNITARIPLELFVAITGVSGSGKSSLITDILYPFLDNLLHRAQKKVGAHKTVEGAEHLDKVIAIDQTPIGRTPRSNPSTYIKVFDDIRDLFTKLPESQVEGYKKGRFSFNVLEGSCPECRGMGMIRIDMDFMDDIFTTCPLCLGKRFDQTTLAIFYKGKNIHDVLEMKVEEAHTFFQSIPEIHHKLSFLLKVGLGYLTLGQSSTTLSGGEAQRIKLARELIRPSKGKTLYILDEPTTGLHFHDVDQLIRILQNLKEEGNSILVIEHNMELIKIADYLIDLGPEGGKDGGQVVARGTPEAIAKLNTPTGIALKNTLKPKKEKKQRRAEKTRFYQPPQAIQVRGASQNNLKNLSLDIPLGKITVCTGPSGSGKSSLAFDTVYAEGQRRYINSLSSYARQFVKQMAKPKLEEINGLLPAIAIEQKHHAGNPRSTVGTMTETYDFLRLIYAHGGTAYCPETGEKIESITADYVVNFLMRLPEKTALQILTPVPISHHASFEELKESLIQKGFLRIRLNGIYYTLDETIPYEQGRKNALFLVVDRIIVRKGIEKRLFEAIEQAKRLTKEPFIVATPDEDLLFNLSFAVPSTGKSFPPLTPHTFSFNAESGMCPDCLGLGFQWGANMLEHKEVMTLSSRNLIGKLWKEELTDEGEEIFFTFLKQEGIDPDLPLYKLEVKELHLLLNGSSKTISFRGLDLVWVGINSAFSKVAKGGEKKLRESVIPLLEQTTCMTCRGERINALARHVKVKGVTIGKLLTLPLDQVLPFIQSIDFNQSSLLDETVRQLEKRLQFLCDIGLHYLSLDRKAPTLSGGETQRIHLARQIGSGLTGCLYVLDEPTIGLHPHNNARLSEALKKLCNLGNTLLLVEHDPLILSIADHIIDFGPQSGKRGGEIMAEGTLSQIKKNPRSLTGLYLSGKKRLPSSLKKASPNKPSKFLSIKNGNKHNLKNLSLEIPINQLTCITGVSGSGKSTLMHHVLKKGMQIHLASRSKKSSITIEGGRIEGVNLFNKLITVDQNPIGHTIRADVSTYSEISSPIRQFFSQLPQAKARGLEPKHFSYNHLKGMCRSCWGLGFKTIQLQPLPSVKVICDSCSGNRLNPLSLQVIYKGKNFGELLKLTVDEALSFLPPISKLQKSLETLQKVGLGYLTLGQEIASLSGGEATRLRLSRELSKRSTGQTLYLFDEPTIGLHADDIGKLISIFQSLIDQGNTVVIIEHHLAILRIAHYLIDLGPEAGEKGGELIATGTPEALSKHPTSHTAKYLRDSIGENAFL